MTTRKNNDYRESITTTRTCSPCGGAGSRSSLGKDGVIITQPCQPCGGTGRINHRTV